MLAAVRRIVIVRLQQLLDDHRVLQSTGSVGDAYDNGMAESFVDPSRPSYRHRVQHSGEPGR